MNELSHVFLIFPGIVIGLVVAAPIGPVNLICIRRTLQYGFLNGFVSGLGAALGDGLFAIVTGFGLTAISQLIEGLSLALQLAGGTLLLCFGLYTYFSQPPSRFDTKAENGDKAGRTLARSMASTFALTITNPATLLGFTAMFTGLGGLAGDNPSFFAAAFVVGGVIVGSSLWWLALTLGVGLLHARIDDRVMRIINHGSGLLVAAFGLGVLGHVAYRLL
ncbi:MAG: LysE family transporter, partial [Alphaproteobacteria bacterium]|nr:LysE family transporter [Alphaproteobacteria bacterium]MBV9693743.1 LysE family transporter [Alphaproteobacteria bacterium]